MQAQITALERMVKDLRDEVGDLRKVILGEGGNRERPERRFREKRSRSAERRRRSRSRSPPVYKFDPADSIHFTFTGEGKTSSEIALTTLLETYGKVTDFRLAEDATWGNARFLLPEQRDKILKDAAEIAAVYKYSITPYNRDVRKRNKA
jgi:hypothetical protein